MIEEKSDDRRIIHGVLTAVFNRGTLIRGASGTGKSELALELIARGHSLVADDAVQITRQGDHLIGSAPQLIAGVLALNGLGLVDVAAMFGKNAVQAETKIDLCIDLTPCLEADDPGLLSEVGSVTEILSVSVPLVRLDVSERQVSPVMIETAVRMLDHPSAFLARRLASEHDSVIIPSSPIPQ